ncbi:hypothetical protein SAMN05421770_107167 [Granulicella rosea]|uniref:Uncharacterized protein n=2 Tax=Granulicella rosea TaxID=474952 RepID=A0A239LQI0_9BACT|nr:hypothetical protein SAMN05421770_107167 [Granulicella rosea]
MFWVGFAARVIFLTAAHKYRIRIHLDHFEFGWEMGRVARALVTGYGYSDPFNGHSGPTAWVPPAYPLLLAGIFKLFGVYSTLSAWVALTVNSLFSAAIAPAVYEIAWRCFGRNARGLKVALWSGWLWALYPAAMQYAVHWIWEMSLTAFLFAWIFVMALRIRGVGETGAVEAGQTVNQTAGRWIVFGAGWGLIALSNSSLLLFLPACAIWMLWDVLRAGRIGLALRNAVLSGVVCIAVVSPWVVRNWYAFHAFVPLRSNFGAEMYEATLPANHGFPWAATLPMAETHPSFVRYRQLGELAYSKEQGVKANRQIKADPGLWVAHIVQRVYFFWFSVPHPIDHLFEEFLRVLNYGWISVASLLGLALAIRQRIPAAWLFFWAFALAPMIYYFVTVQARFRHPLEPLMTVLIVYLFQSAETRRQKVQA